MNEAPLHSVELYSENSLGKLQSRINRKQEELLNNPNKVWEGHKDDFEKQKKYTQLELDENGWLILTIIKPGNLVRLYCRGCLPQDVEKVRAKIKQIDWEKPKEYPPERGKQPRIYRFEERTLDLGNGWRLVWNGKHTTINDYYSSVEDTLKLEKV